MPRTLFLALLVTILSTTVPAFAEETVPRRAELELVDGTRLVGDVLAETEQVVTFRAGGITRAYARKRVSGLRTLADDDATPEGMRDGDESSDVRKPERKADGTAKSLSPEALEWLQVLISRLESTDRQVTGSVTKAILALGPGAREPLEKALAGAPPSSAEVIEQILARVRGRKEKGVPTPAVKRPADAPDEAMDADSSAPVLAEAGARQAAERLRKELGLPDTAAEEVLAAVVEFRAGQVQLARARSRLDDRKYVRRTRKLVERTVDRLAPRLDAAAILLLRERLGAWSTPSGRTVSE